MKKAILLAGLLFCINSISFSQDKAADLKKLFELMNSDQMIDQIMDNLTAVFKQQASTQFNGENAKEEYDEFIEYLMIETKELGKKLINVELVAIYDKYFNHKEILDLIKFYESETGQKMIQVTPDVSKDLMTVVMQKYIPEYQKKITDKLQSQDSE